MDAAIAPTVRITVSYHYKTLEELELGIVMLSGYGGTIKITPRPRKSHSNPLGITGIASTEFDTMYGGVLAAPFSIGEASEFLRTGVWPTLERAA